MLGKGIKKQRGGFIAPIVTALAPTAIELVSKLIGGRQNGSKRQNNYGKSANPKRVTLPNRRTFYAKYKRATRADLPANVQLERPFRRRAAPRGRRRRFRQGGRGFKSAFKKVINFAKKVGKNKFQKHLESGNK